MYLSGQKYFCFPQIWAKKTNFGAYCCQILIFCDFRYTGIETMVSASQSSSEGDGTRARQKSWAKTMKSHRFKRRLRDFSASRRLKKRLNNLRFFCVHP